MQWQKETWWWNDSIEDVVCEKTRCFRNWKAGGSRENYNAAKRIAKRIIHHAKSDAEKELFQNIDP